MLSLSSSLLPRVCLARALLCFSLLPRVCLVCKLVFLQQSPSFSAALLSLLPVASCPCLLLKKDGWGSAFAKALPFGKESSPSLPRPFLLARNLHLPGTLWQGVFILSCWWCSKASRVALAVQGHFTDFP